MWAHYSNKHTGICLEFDTSAAAIGGAYQVMYNSAPPVLDVHTVADKEVIQILLNKSSVWNYEDEYRVVAHEGAVAGGVTPAFLPITNLDFLPLAPEALTAVIAGCQADFDKIKALVDKHAPGLPVKRAVRATKAYSLSIED
jgi:hypothetical protein